MYTQKKSKSQMGFEPAMLSVSSYESVRGWQPHSAVPVDTHNLTLAYHRVSSSSVVRVSNQIMEGRGFKYHLRLRFFPTVRFSQNLQLIISFFCQVFQCLILKLAILPTSFQPPMQMFFGHCVTSSKSICVRGQPAL